MRFKSGVETKKNVRYRDCPQTYDEWRIEGKVAEVFS
jgi:hypothetical protein